MVEKAPACVGCLKWDLFKEKCWVFWEHKKICSMHAKTRDEWDANG